MHDVNYFQEKVRQCRRLAKWTTDEGTSKALEVLALDFEAKAHATEAKENADKAQANTVVCLGNGEDGTLIGPNLPNSKK